MRRTTEGSDAITRLRLISAVLVLGLASTSSIAQELNFKNLPGVVQPRGPALEFKDTGNTEEADCTTGFEIYGTENTVPQRVYKCRKGGITITSDKRPEGY